MNFKANPYVKKGGPRLQKSVVAYVDILGYRNHVNKAFEKGSEDSLLKKLHMALTYTREHIDP